MLIPLGERVVVRRDAAQEQIGSVVIPSAHVERPQRGIVVSVGNVAGLTAGDAVLFGKFSGVEVEHDGEALLILHIDEVFCRIAPYKALTLTS